MTRYFAFRETSRSFRRHSLCCTIPLAVSPLLATSSVVKDRQGLVGAAQITPQHRRKESIPPPPIPSNLPLLNLKPEHSSRQATGFADYKWRLFSSMPARVFALISFFGCHSRKLLKSAAKAVPSSTPKRHHWRHQDFADHRSSVNYRGATLTHSPCSHRSGAQQDALSNVSVGGTSFTGQYSVDGSSP
jgi:hypothetical protein